MPNKNLYIIILSCLLITAIFGCSPSDLEPAATNVVNETAEAQLEKLLVEVEIKSGLNSDRYIVMDSIKNIVVNINNELWGTFHYFENNKENFDDLLEIDAYQTTASPFSHQIVLNYLSTAEDYQYADEFASFLTNFIQPGDYFCDINSLSLYNELNEETNVNIVEDFIITVDVDQHSVFVGKIEITL